MEFKPIGVTEAEAAAVTDHLRTSLVNLDVFTVLDRAQIETVLGELAFQQRGVTDPGEAVEVGKLLNVEYIITGRVTALQKAFQVNSQMIRVKTAEVVRSENLLHRGDLLGLLSEDMDTVAARLAQVEREEPPPTTVVGPGMACRMDEQSNLIIEAKCT